MVASRKISPTPSEQAQNSDFKNWTKIRHYEYPDYDRSPLEIPTQARDKIFQRLCFLYGEETAKQYLPELERVMQVYYAHKPPARIAAEQNIQVGDRFTEQDVILITYGDLLRSETSSPLASLVHILEQVPGFKKAINTLHILPFFPYSSDRGFSVTDFRNVDPKLGSWQDIAKIGDDYKLMFDAVCNHTSSKSKAFQKLLSGNPEYKDIATVYLDPNELTPEDRKLIVRPRTSDVLTKFQSINGAIWVWTTFSADQIDLNYCNPKVLLWVIETLLLYVRRGADLIRLDAVTYLWQIPGTSCANLPQTHETIKLFHDIFAIVAPGVSLITETNIPHQENIAYFGNGNDEAQMVYNFALPPLVLHTFYREDTEALAKWASNLEFPSEACTYLNILDTHDGIGLMGVKNILTNQDIDFLISRAREHGAFISYKTGAGGKDEPYEINTTWYSALNLDSGSEPLALQIKRFVASRSIALVLKGVPGIYLHGLIGTSNDVDTVIKTKSKRDINRQVISETVLDKELKLANSKLSQLTQALGKLLENRVRQRAFHPQGKQQILNLSHQCFVVLRVAPDGKEHILTITNVSNQTCQLEIPLDCLPLNNSYLGSSPENNYWYDLIGNRGWRVQQQKIFLVLHPYDVIWLVPYGELEKNIENHSLG
ncbi:sugar phosphorylase [Waterburya agarophytonicola K14]|uniref:Sugar phosphorylase n=1 Tax=Waterburya agarophytonicola KI4 TaxID=2874699 RepID=A0A964FEJ5_9CYAN|nr:alpha-amylase family glycosyl hydrolase [Waterburya agarophytonicola]MCC0175962.1 sugar phosphorylase [Waterburya agarophytonicola KI4]